jgi:hypothetical protein
MQWPTLSKGLKSVATRNNDNVLTSPDGSRSFFIKCVSHNCVSYVDGVTPFDKKPRFRHRSNRALCDSGKFIAVEESILKRDDASAAYESWSANAQ